MKKLDLKSVPKNLKKDPILKSLPKELKEKSAYQEVESKIKLIMFSDHKHATVSSYVKCKRCNEKINKKQQALKEFGFASYSQYLHWKRIMEIIINEKDFEII